MIGVRADGRKDLVALVEIWNAEDKRHALDAVTAFDAAYGATLQSRSGVLAPVASAPRGPTMIPGPGRPIIPATER